MRAISHYAQSIRANVFAKYDYGLIQNLEKYGTAQPPQYDLSKWDGPPVVIFYGGQVTQQQPRT